MYDAAFVSCLRTGLPLVCICVDMACFQISRRQHRRRAPTSTAGMARRVWPTWEVRAASATRRRSAATRQAAATAERRAAVTNRRTARRANCDCSLVACRPTLRSHTMDHAMVSSVTILSLSSYVCVCVCLSLCLLLRLGELHKRT